jgi:hypothetical protein
MMTVADAGLAAASRPPVSTIAAKERARVSRMAESPLQGVKNDMGGDAERESLFDDGHRSVRASEGSVHDHPQLLIIAYML